MSQSQKKRLVAIAAGGLVVILAVQFLVLPAVKYRKQLTRKVHMIEGEYARIARAAAEYIAAAGEKDGIAAGEGLEKLSAKGSPQTLFAFLEGAASKTGVRGRVKLMKPSARELGDGRSEESVAMRLSGLFMDELVRFLYEAETRSAEACVKRIHMRRVKDALDIEVVFCRVEGAPQE